MFLAGAAKDYITLNTEVIGKGTENEYTVAPKFTIDTYTQSTQNVNNDGRTFKRMYVSFKANIDAAKHCGLKFMAVDACFFKHKTFNRYKLLVLVTRDSNNEVLLLAVAIVPAEDGEQYTWFGQQCNNTPDLAEYMKDGVIYSDIHGGIPYFVEEFENLHHCHCFFHVLGACRVHLKTHHRQQRHFEDEDAWRVQKAQTRELYVVALAQLRFKNSAVSYYLNNDQFVLIII